jgi:general secretion pathway protein M
MTYVAALLATIAWGLANDGAYRELQASYAGKSEVLASLKKRAPTDLAGSRPAFADLNAAAIAAPSETVAASALQRYLLDRLESAGGSVQSVQAEPSRETKPPGLLRLSAQVAFDASIVALQKFLYDLETGLPFVFVDSLGAQPATAVQPGTRAGDRLRVTLTVTSYWKAGEAAGVRQ